MAETIGLQAEFDTSGFDQGLRDYQAGLDSATQSTDAAAQSMDSVANSETALTEQTDKAKFSFTEFQSALALAGQVADIAKSIFEATAGAVVEYAGQIKALAGVTGTGAEETSKLIQVADDANVSFQSLRLASKNLVDNGIQPTISNLAALADQYVAIEDPVQRAQFVMETFGDRAGPELARLLEQGGQAIRDSAAAAEQMGLVMSEQGVKDAEEFRLALDDLSDSFEALKIQVGQQAIPALKDHVDIWTTTIAALKSGKMNIFQLDAAFYKAMLSGRGMAGAVDDINAKLNATGPAANLVASALANAAAAMTPATKSAQEWTSNVGTYMSDMIAGWTAQGNAITDVVIKQRDYNDAIIEAAAVEMVNFGVQGQLNSVYEQQTAVLAGLQVEQGNIVNRLTEMAMAGQQDTEEFRNLEAALQDNETAQQDAKAAIAEATSAMIFQRVAATLDSADLLKLSRDMGLLSETDYNLATALNTLTEHFDTNKDGMVSAAEGADQYMQAIMAMDQAAADGVLTLEEVEGVLSRLDGKTFQSTYVVNVKYPGAGRPETGWEGPPILDPGRPGGGIEIESVMPGSFSGSAPETQKQISTASSKVVNIYMGGVSIVNGGDEAAFEARMLSVFSSLLGA